MKRLLLLLLFSLFVSSSAFAGSFGLGWSNGFSVCVPAGPVDLQGILGFKRTDPGGGGDSNTTVNLTGFVMFPLTKVEKAKLSFFTGMTMKSVTDMDTGYGVLFGLAPAVKVTSHLALSAKLGLKYMKDPVVTGGDANKYLGSCGGVAVHWFF